MSDSTPLRYFPYEAPYSHQREAIERIHGALADGSDILFEGATGTGKTLAALTPALDHARAEDKTVLITTNVHQQMRQFRREASAIAETEALRAVVFQGKASMCHIDVGYEECRALRETTRDLVEAEGDLAELEERQRELLKASQAGDDEATSARASVLDELEAVEDDLAEFADRATCDHYYRNLTADTSDFFAWLYEDVRTPSEIYDFAEERGFCGYELLKEGVEGVDLVVCNYHHLLDPAIREQFFRWLGRDPEDVIAIFDEAHNVESAARDHARRTLTETTVTQALGELASVDDPRTEAAANVVTAFREALVETYESALSRPERAALDEEWEDIAIDHDDRRDAVTLAFLQAYTGPGYDADLERALALGRDLDSTYEQAYQNGETTEREECQTLQVATFLESWLAESNDRGTYPVISVRRRDGSGPDVPASLAADFDEGRAGSERGDLSDDRASERAGDRSPGRDGSTGSRDGKPDDIYGRAELYTCIPEQVTRPLFEELSASVLMSATLRPFEVTEDVLGLEDSETMAYGQQFPAERRRTFAVDGPALFASKREDRAVQETITETLEDAIRMTPGNTLCFFPSYAEAARYHGRVDGGTRYLDEPGTGARDLREQFTSDDDGVLFTSLWGTLGEGVSYDGDDCRTVVVVGVPYPHLDERMEAVQGAYAAAFGGDERQPRGSGDGPGAGASEDIGWRYAVEIPTVRKTRQALGRVIRSPEDFGVRILLDARYTERASVEMPDYAVRGTFPPEERAELVDVDPEKLQYAMLNFYGDLDAYDGNAPDPRE